jgi:hypothetical protein
VKKVMQAVAAHRKAGDELAEYHEFNCSVDKFGDGAAVDKRGYHHENNRQNIEQQEPVPEPDGASVLPSYSSRKSVPVVIPVIGLVPAGDVPSGHIPILTMTAISIPARAGLEIDAVG